MTVPHALDRRTANAPSPTEVYVRSLGTESSRRSMLRSLNAVVGVAADLAGFESDSAPDAVENFAWTRLDYPSAVAIRAAMAERWSPATVNRHLAAVRGVLRSAVLMGVMDRRRADAATAGLITVRGTALPAGRMVTAGELHAMFARLAEVATPTASSDAALLAILAATGARRAEICGLDVADWTPATGELRIRHGKGGRQRLAYMHGGAIDAVEAWLDHRGRADGPLLVPVRKDGRIDPALTRLSTNAIWRRCQRIATQAGVPSTSPHDHRRTVASVLLDRVDISVVAGLLGHAQISTTARYDRRPETARRQASEHIAVPYVPPR